jgi:ATP-dependent DNA helicase DinG
MISILKERPESREAWIANFLNLVEKVFSEDGSLVSEMGFEHRQEQGEMAISVARSLVGEKHLIVEAGTGVGKSLAYLIPAILYSRITKRPCVIATNTISLQEQLLEKDVPSVRDLFQRSEGLEEYVDFKCALLVGRANYLCSNRLARALLGQGDLFEGRQREELKRISEWASKGPLEGIRQEISPIPLSTVWECVNADSSLCSPKSCNPENCHYRKARSLVDQAEVIVVNHSLFFSLMAAGAGPQDEGDGIIFPSDFVIFDEAHEMPEVASEHLGVSISSWGLETFLRRLYNPKKGKGLLAKIIRSQDLQRFEEAKIAVEEFFHYLHVETLGENEKVRIREGHSLPMEVFPPFGKMLRSLVELGDLAEGESSRLEVKDLIKRAQAYLMALSEVVEQKNKEHVYWVERTGSKKDIIHLRSAPLRVAEILEQELFAKGSSVIMTSATITRKGDARFFKNEVGVRENDEKILKSPFDYRSSMNIRIVLDAPNPMANDRSPYLTFLSRSIFQLARSMEGGTLVLFTNYSDLKYCYRDLQDNWHKTGRNLYAQGEGMSRSELRQKMIEDGDSLLLGAESFWKGFDAKGRCLSQVILTRLPFENPNHPLKEARSEYCESQNKNPFREITLPTAVVRFRQGVGRLIRSRTDCGDLVILDSRIMKQNYGKDFLSELPHNSVDRISIEEIFGYSDDPFDNGIDF